MKSKPTKFEDKLEKGTFDDKLRYLLKKHNGLELRKAISTLCEEEVKRARLEEINRLGMKYLIDPDQVFEDRISELEKGK